MTIKKLILVRHGESEWNKENRFTGWADVDLSEKGRVEAQQAGNLLKKKGFSFDFAYTSVLRRATNTLSLILDVLQQQNLPIEKSWRLNERHYGALQGLNKSETAAKFGSEQVKQWRRGFSTLPPALTLNDPRSPANDSLYATLNKNDLPLTESLATTVDRVVPYWDEVIKPRIIDGKRVIIVAHGNSIRALVKYVDHLSEEEIMEINIPTAVPLVYEFNSSLQPINHYYLGNAEEITQKVAAVAAQGKA
ncbi:MULTISPECIES: 2,3-diphosphoglycerate-dependent phosphoglycerate mutase [Candidatus Williamhamiltonella]|uniref:2,3-bisphosphoglycerate-dependent phosphoglycerate mutase n=1 Tax=Candidatus Williamhamiltonella defendens TaxID=138072 RepID=A0A2D3TCQ0_9ENTR|nr:2,3-diphosphoglycerate-dependent phosphoglycerate mutase [Candidatus Hamiltonella defensa]ATW33484.1 phosphoglyceromutase [Candidatus Hamiltonella defensa]AYB48472.1 2,3-diphosphoglycerate-dependent phosphoglycerate mutase [Candidatus Hamiltonella defensa]